jgi:hypothetical protein
MDAPHTGFGHVDIDQLGELRDLGIRIMGSADRSFGREVLEGWLGRNPEVVHTMRAHGRIAGYAIILPLTDEMVEKVIRGEVRPSKIPPEAIQSFQPGEASLYLAEMIVDQSLAQRSMGAAVLVRHCMRFFAEKSRLGFHATGLWCIAISPQGIEFGRRLGCREIHIEGVSSPTRVAMKLEPAARAQAARESA